MAPLMSNSPLHDIASYITSRISVHCSVKIPFPLERLPYELRLRIYELAFAFPVEIIHLDKLSLTNNDQTWMCETALIAGDCNFYPYGLKRIPEPLQDEALAIAYQTTIFKATQMDQIFRLYPMLGRVGLENIESIHIDWIKTEEVNFATPSALDHNDAQATQVISLLKSLPRLRHLSIQLNGYAFTLAYVNANYRRLDSLNGDFFERHQLTYAISHYYDGQGKRIDVSDTPLGSVVQMPNLGPLWKVKNYGFVPYLHINIARCDPFFGALSSLSGLKSFKLKQSPHLPGGLDGRIEKALSSIVTDSIVREPGENAWFLSKPGY